MIQQVLFRRSSRGVPHTLIDVDGTTYSYCYFLRTNIIRVWDYRTQKVICSNQLRIGQGVDIEELIKKHTQIPVIK